MRTVKICLKPNDKQNTRLHQCAAKSARLYHSCGNCFYCGRELVEVGNDYVKICNLFPRDVCCLIRLAQKGRIYPGNYPAGFYFDGVHWFILIHVDSEALIRKKRRSAPIEEQSVIEEDSPVKGASADIVSFQTEREKIRRLYRRQARLQRSLIRKNNACPTGKEPSARSVEAGRRLKALQHAIRIRQSEI